MAEKKQYFFVSYMWAKHHKPPAIALAGKPTTPQVEQGQGWTVLDEFPLIWAHNKSVDGLTILPVGFQEISKEQYEAVIALPKKGN